MRLFTGIEIPRSVAQRLAALQPRPVPGLRLVKAEQIHLTLHFIGDGDVELYRLAMEGLSVPGFTMTIDQLGCFSSRRTTILWAGVREGLGLMQLHAALESCLVSAGYQPEKRAYHPHITLGRCDERVAGRVVDGFVEQSMEPMEVRVEEVVLFSSELSEKGPWYERERVVRLGDVRSG